MRYRNVVLLAFVSLLILGLASADFSLGKSNSSVNGSYHIESSYGPKEKIKGWINISLDEEPVDSLLTGFGSEITLKKFLENNGIDCSYSDKCECSPASCETGYIVKGSGAKTLNLSISARKFKTIGLKLTGNVTDVNRIEFDIFSDASGSCTNPLKIDLLADGSYEWAYEEVSSGEECYIKDEYGCFYDSNSTDSTLVAPGYVYCENIKVPGRKAFRIGADLTGVGNANFEMMMDVGETKTCAIYVNANGESGCTVEFDEALEEETEAEVCIKLKEGTGNYSIKYEDKEPLCGVIKTEEEESESPKDFKIFARPLKYDGINKKVRINQLSLYGEEGNTLKELLTEYISTQYSGDCNPECIIPARFYAGAEQNLSISNALTDYRKNSLPSINSEDYVYEINSTNALISSDFIKLNLEKAGILTPSTYGKKELSLELGGDEIFDEEVFVKSVPTILGIYPQEVSVLVPETFVIFLEESKNLTYVFDFGDGSEVIEAEEPYAVHTYTAIDNYDLKVTVLNENGNSTETFNIDAVAPSKAINKTIKEYRSNLESIKKEIDKLPEWIKSEALKKVDVDYLKSQLEKLDSKYKETVSAEEDTLVKIMKDLIALNIPASFERAYKTDPAVLIINEKQIDTMALEEVEAGTPELSPLEYSGMINSWIQENLNAKIESEVFSLIYPDSKRETLFSYIKVTLEPKLTADSGIYFIINGNPANIKINGERKTKDIGESAVAVIFDGLAGEESIEILHPLKVDPVDYPVYLSPDLEELGESFSPGPCNHNKECESGENSTNCRSDCKPWLWTILWLLILIFVTLVIYIVLQEWYKKNYEKHLFKDRNQLFNLINFMNNSANQGLGKKEIFERLKKMKWEEEQMEYAWRKFRGERTGMWEIPLFKWAENRRVAKEIQKRGSAANRDNPAFKK